MKALPIVVLLAFAGSLPAAIHTVNSASSLSSLLSGGTVQPGDTIQWTNGTYSGTQSIAFQGVNGTSTAPITLRAQTAGGVTFTGQASIRIGGNWLVVSGFRFQGTEASSIIQFRSTSNVEAHNCRVTDCAIVSPAPSGTSTSKWVQIYGTNNRVDHCTFRGKRSRGALLVVELGGLGATQNANHVIEHNHLVDFPQPAGESDPNEYEGMRIGFSGDQDKPANCLVRYNLFEGMDADPESISNKSSGNRYLHNTFRACASQLVSRHGDNCTFAGNFILGEGKPGAGGIRIVGTGHDIYNNYISGLRTSSTDNGWFTAIGLMSGSTSAPADGYERVEDVMVFHNTIVDCDIPIVVGEGHGGNGRPTAPTNCLFADNLIASSRGQLITHNGSPTAITYATNIGYGSPVGIAATSGQISTSDPAMALSDGLMRPSAAGPAANAASDTFAEVSTDIDAQSRPASGKDIGADEVAGATGGILHRPLGPSDVGASFLGGPGGGDTTPTITTTTLPSGTVGVAYNQSLAATGGELPLNWSLAAGTLPAGLMLSTGGVISGTPAAPGTSDFTVQVADGDNDTDTQALSLAINPSASDPEIVPIASPDSTPWDTAGSNGPDNLWDGATGDGANSSRWASNSSPGTLASAPRYVVLDLGATHNVSKFVLWPYQGRAYHYEIYVSDSTTAWGSAVVNVQQSAGSASYTHNVGAVGRYVRLVVDGITGSTSTWASINELDIFGSVASGGTVAAPTFSPGGGSYASAQSVTITTSTSGASIRYTLDGSSPTSASGTLYGGPVSIAASATLKAIAYKAGMSDSGVSSATYTIGTGGGTTRREAESFDASSGGTFTIKNDASASAGKFVDFPTAGITATYGNLPSAGGSRVVTFRYRNGDSSGTNRTMTIALNGAAPVTVTFPGNGNWTSYQLTTATVSFSNSATNTAVLASSNAPDLDYLEYAQ
ncbi:MAG TPA: chondroitinase-B domain-containing protein [Opitutaceae bacterium]|nr:chondroitinase-B domain-containing protein [Opitutaceae bacterium]